MSKPRRPKNTIDCSIDLYFREFAVPKEKPVIIVNCFNNAYDDSCTEIMREHAKFLLKAADWLEGQNE